MVGILIADGFNYSEYEAVKGALTAAGAFVFTVGPKRQAVIPSSGGNGVKLEHHVEAFRSTAFDTLYIPGGEHIATLKKKGRVVHVSSSLSELCLSHVLTLVVGERSIRPSQGYRSHR